MIEEYLTSIKNAVNDVKNRENVIIDFCFYINEDLEKLDTSKTTMT